MNVPVCLVIRQWHAERLLQGVHKDGYGEDAPAAHVGRVQPPGKHRLLQNDAARRQAGPDLLGRHLKGQV